MTLEQRVFQKINEQAQHSRAVQKMRYSFVYTSEQQTVTGQQTTPVTITIDQSADFDIKYITGFAYSYNASDASSFPMPNSAGSTAFAGRGLSVQITEDRSGRQLTSGFVPWELIFSPGYGQNFQNPMPFRYYVYRNSKLRFDVRNRDNDDRTHYFGIALIGEKINCDMM